MTAGWDLARLWHTIARIGPDRPALVHGNHTLTWGQFDAAAAAVAEALQGDGVRPGDVAVLCLPNRPEYLVLLAGALRCGVTPCGVNYRYQAGELAAQLHHLAPAVVFYDIFDADTITSARAELPGIRRWCAVGGNDQAVAGALTVDRLLAVDADPRNLTSSVDDVLIKCTGGTTGAPLALRWRVSDTVRQLNDHNPWLRHDLRQPPSASTRLDLADARLLVVSPLMHGSGLTRALGALCVGGAVITTPLARLDAAAILDAAEQHRADTVAIVGDAYALPLADALDTDPDRWALPNLRVITSSGVAWSQAVKQRLLTHLPAARLVESLGATEATGLGFSVATSANLPPTGLFQLGRHAQVFRPDHGPAALGETGLIGVSWPHPAGLHPAGDLPADRFIHHAGRRYLLSGDQVQLVTDREFVLLGRGVDCINTGGEKVHAPEVVDVLTSQPGVIDACVFGIPHARLGSAVAAVVHLRSGASLTEVLMVTSDRLARFKTPTVAVQAPVPRTAVGKVDLAAARALIDDHCPEGAR